MRPNYPVNISYREIEKLGDFSQFVSVKAVCFRYVIIAMLALSEYFLQPRSGALFLAIQIIADLVPGE